MRRFYASMKALDLDALRATLHEDMVGVVTAGLEPYGGEHRGADAMIRDVWVPVYRRYQVLPTPDEIVDAGGGRYVVTGRYEGPATDAEFVHLFHVDGERIRSLRQVTDTARWAEPPL